MKDLLEHCGAADIFRHKSPGPADLKKIVTDKLSELDMGQRIHDMQTMSRLDVYRDVIGDVVLSRYAPAEYVKRPLQRPHRAALARLRSGTLRIAIETGRYRRVDVEDRLCQQCDIREVENARHFVFTCPAYSDIRRDVLGTIADTRNMETLFASTENMKKASRYIIECFKLR